MTKSFKKRLKVLIGKFNKKLKVKQLFLGCIYHQYVFHCLQPFELMVKLDEGYVIDVFLDYRDAFAHQPCYILVCKIRGKACFFAYIGVGNKAFFILQGIYYHENMLFSLG